jgi:hypothetical protein
MESHGFTAEVHETADLVFLKQRYGVPPSLSGCHTVLIDGYVVEGHVPAPDVERLLLERPPIVGIAVPGMPIGSPGMEVVGRPPERYDVIAFAADGTTSIFASY